MSRLLILSCSQRKRIDAPLLPAIERYDGPTFRLLRRFLDKRLPEQPEIYILSARFGLIQYNEPIPNYDQRMTQKRAVELQPYVLDTLSATLSVFSFQALCISVGRDYVQALSGFSSLVPSNFEVKIASGSQGKRLSELYTWLYKEAPNAASKPALRNQNGKATLRGVEVNLTSEQILDVARNALARNIGNPMSYQTWYVPVDQQRVAPKWLVSQLTGLPVSSFHSDEARQVLEQLGIEVYTE
jgi:hypothetical protein